MTRAEFCAFVREHDNFVILTHRRPDGDTIGCASALCLGLRQLGKSAAVLQNEQFTPRFAALLEGLVCEDAPADACVISTDIASEGLLSFDAVRLGLTPVCAVDHHGSNSLACPKLVEAALAACGAQCHVAKNNFMRTALTDAGLPDIGEHLVGQTAFVTGASDVAGAAKAINTFAKASKKAEYKVAILDGAILSADEIRAIGELPPRDQLLAKLLGTINAAGSALARVIQAYVDKENGGSEEPAA